MLAHNIHTVHDTNQNFPFLLKENKYLLNNKYFLTIVNTIFVIMCFCDNLHSRQQIGLQKDKLSSYLQNYVEPFILYLVQRFIKKKLKEPMTYF
ncbi:MAG: hypothetical protein BWY04_01442 [candidate division CPR1 bacterium ADurb.Bin160]|uniref:Uncharacterized protein n=1 Tax=candidate division CPR1 bacterium ADurb.Bin160 TaxID=1852826 RepID=A0A1V5ZIR5_9BACT|nr:MAG: hypothetical protein BWY04_01442 [candidate division CPR1 bacterium ADurb.Bin160]